MGKYAYILLVHALLLIGNSSLYAQLSDEEMTNIGHALYLWKDRTANVPVYDINNSPIAFYLLKHNGNNVGFIICGHAESSVCKMASLEILTFMGKYPKHTNSYFSFGIGYDIRPDSTNLWSKAYSDELEALYNNFEALEGSVNQPDHNFYTVVSDTVDFDEYLAAKRQLVTISETEREQYNNGLVTVVELDMPQLPFITGFNYANGEPISFEIAKKDLKELEPEYIYSSYLQTLKEFENDLKDMAKSNREQLYALKYKDSNVQYMYMQGLTKDFEVVVDEFLLPFYPRHYDTWTITDNNTGKVTHTLTYPEALEYINDGNKLSNQEEFEKELKEYKEQFDRNMIVYDSLYNAFRKEIPQAYGVHQKSFSYWFNEIKGLRQEVYQSKNTEIIVDAFLRGWPVYTADEELTDKLDKIVQEKRDAIWEQLLTQHPDIVTEYSLAGILQNDNAFLHIRSSGNKYIITPMQVLGGPVSRILQPKRGVVRYISTYSLRSDN